MIRVIKINIASMQYSLQTESYEIYVSGCKEPHCIGCHNPELWDFNVGYKLNHMLYDKIKDDINSKSRMIEHIFILGGEPLDQDKKELIKLLKFLDTFNKQIWLFTRYKLQDVDNDIKDLVHYIKYNRYIDKLKTDDNIQFGIKLATSNQQIKKING